jgi:hypothetical protein
VALSRAKSKGRSDGRKFVKAYREVLESDEYAALSAYAIKLMFDLYTQFRGNNNGDLCAAWSVMKARGWRSPGTLHQATRELLEKGWIITARKGGRNKASLFALTFLPVDECKGKLDISATTVASNAWRGDSCTRNTYQINTNSDQSKRKAG